MLIAYLIFPALLLFVLAYYYAYESCRYKTARRLAKELGGSAVFKIGRSYMRRDHGGVEERAWIDPDDHMAWRSILTIVYPPTAKLFLQRGAGPGFRFHVEPKSGMLLRTISLGGLKHADFNAPRLDESLRLLTDNHAEAVSYFSAPEKQQALLALFRAEFNQLKGEHGTLLATMKSITAENLNPETLDRFFGYLRSL